MKTLIIVDAQYDFMPGGALAVPDGDAVVPAINAMQDDFDLIVATQDWHPPGHKSFASAHPGRKPFEVIELHGLEQTLWPDHCVEGSAGAELHGELDMRRVEAIVRKGMDPEIDSYSGFYDNGHRKSTGLNGLLRDKGATELHVCGLAADICVYYTLMDALKLGFSATLQTHATRPLDPDAFKAAKEDIVRNGGVVGG